MLLDIQSRLQGRGPGYERWLKIHNLKEAARTLNYLTEHDITEYDVLAAQAASTASEFEKVSASIKQYEHRIEQVAALKTHIINYAKTHDTYVAYRKASPREKAAFRSAHEADLLLHEAAKRAFNDLGTKKLPTVKILQAEYADLLAKKKTAYEDFKRLRKESQESVENSIKEFGAALKNHDEYSTTFEVNGETLQIYGNPLPCSEWYLVSVMPYSILNKNVDALENLRIFMVGLACASILIFLSLIFIRYFFITRSQVYELEKARQIALEASTAKSKFLANMSHDIRTPMNAIVGMTAIATAHIDDQKQVQNCLRKITLSSKHLLGLINDVLDMSKIESGKLTLTTDQISLKEVVEGIVNIMQPQIKAKRQTFNIHVENILTENVWCDGVRLNQVLLNLLSNSTKYTPEGGSIQLSFSEEKSPKGENYIRIHIKVKDNGIGMSPDFLKRIYEPYSRADGVRVSKTQGTGLGMAITKYIVEAMEGSLNITSELDKGTEVSLTFDFENAVALEMDMVLPSWNMLVVDDDELLCRTAIDTLKTIGINADWVLSGEKAIELVIQHHQKRDDYQIILLDWKLPGMNGIQVAKEIRRNLGDEVPILLISAYDWSEFEAEAREAGISGFISKPLFKSTLYHALRQYMGAETENDQTLNHNIDLSGRRILLAEDNELNWEVAKELLSDLGVELDWAEDGQICLDKFQRSPEGYYDAILISILIIQLCSNLINRCNVK